MATSKEKRLPPPAKAGGFCRQNSMNFGKLNQLEETMTSLAAYLIIADKKHPKQFLGESDDPQVEIKSGVKIRLTQHYVAAMLAYGVPRDEPELRRVAEWYSTPFPQHPHDDIDPIEMTKLEGLLQLRPEDPSTRARLHQLVEQRSTINGLFEIDPSKGETIFDTLWALKLLLVARQRGVLDDVINRDDIRASINSVLDMGTKDKDLALALRLRYDLFGDLEPEHEKQLNRLIEQARECGHLWGISRRNIWNRMEGIIQAMHKRQLSANVIGNYEKDFHNVIVNTCYVIENLTPLAVDYPELQEELQFSMDLWWRQFQGENAPVILKGLFANEYNFLRAVCRTMVAVNSYVGGPLGARLWLRPLRAMSQKYSSDDWPERESIERALRQWIGIELGFPDHLKLGLSEASVIRIAPTIYNPTEDGRNNLLGGESLVVKYGPIQEIENERKNYNALNQRLRSFFVRIPEEVSHINESRQAFVVMEDLLDYRTLYEVYDLVLRNEDAQVPIRLGEFLLTIHRADMAQLRWATNNHVRDIYIVPMLTHVDQMLRYINQMNEKDLVSGEQLEYFLRIERKLNNLIAGIMQHQERIERFPLACMHGDLHSRNIMLRTLEKGGQWTTADLEFKLIDLESLRMDGDAAHDAGQLLVDLELLPNTGKPNVRRTVLDNLYELRVKLRDNYRGFAVEREDETFETRLELARARAFIRIAKGLSKRSEKHLQNREDQQAFNFITHGMSLAELAVQPLQTVYDTISTP